MWASASNKFYCNAVRAGAAAVSFDISDNLYLAYKDFQIQAI
jgi:hypothetical protein